MSPTQRRLIVALVVTVACLPLLALDLLGSHSGSTTARETAQVSTAEPDPSLVVATNTTSSSSTATTEPVTATTAPPATVAPSTTVTTAAPVTTTTAAPTTTTTVYVPPPPPPAPTMSGDAAAFFACVRQRESGGNYGAVDPSGTYRGAYQIYQGAWDTFAARIGRTDLIGVPPNLASPADQDAIALAMYQALGKAPWQAHGQTYSC